MEQQQDIIVVGGGIAGVSAAEAARRHYPKARVALLASEAVPFYNKIALNAFWAGKRPRRQMHFYPTDWLEQLGVECHWDTAVQAVDPERSELTLSDSRRVNYSKLILATGAEPVLPPISGIELPGICPLWNLSDAETIRAALPDAHSVAIIGGGILGIEAAVELADIGKHVTVVEARPRLLPLHLNDRAAALYEDFLAQKGVAVRTNIAVQSIKQIDSEWRLTLDDGETHSTDLVMVLAGVAPNTELARKAGLEVRQGIVVDDQMQTSHPDILACGNCTELDGGTKLLWNPAKRQGAVAGANALEQHQSLQPDVETIHVKTPQMPLYIGGRPQESEPGDRLLIEDTDDAYRLVRIDDQGKIVGAIFLKETDCSWQMERAIDAGRVVSEQVLAQESVAAVIDELRGHRHEYDPTTGNWVCQMCGYNFEGDNPPEICPVCAVGKDQFLAA